MKSPILASVLLASLLSPASFAATKSLKVADYFAGKDETCLESAQKKVSGTIHRLVQVTDVFSPTDSETYCSVVVKVGTKERIFSASQSKCAGLRELLSSKEANLKVAKDHICEF